MEDTKDVIEGNSVVLLCPITAIPTPLYRWIKNRDIVSDHSDDDVQFTLLEDGNKLQILNATSSHSGKYTCIGTNQIGEAYHDTHLNVLVPPKFQVPLNTSIQDVIVIEDSSFLLNCLVTGNPHPKISWIKDGLPVSPISTPSVSIISEGHQLYVPEAHIFDAGYYTCIATNKAGSVKRPFSVSVLVPPKMEGKELENVEVLLALPINLECPVSGLPPPTVIWMKNGRLLDEQHHRLLQLSEDGRRLTFLQTTMTDGGHYTCVAHNEAGEARKNISLDVLVPPSIQGQGDVSKAKVNLSDSVVLECNAQGVPTPRITWMKDSQMVSLLLAQGVKILNGGHLLHIENATIHDRGRYTCLAINKVGTAEKEYQLNVLEPPRLTERSPLRGSRKTEAQQDVMFNMPATFYCGITGSPPPKITWMKGNETISPATHARVSLVDDGRQLRIDHALLEDAGSYTCMAKNEAGEVKKDFDLNVLVPPAITDPRAVINPRVREDDSLSLQCPVSGNPLPSIIWIKDGQMVTSQTHPGVEISQQGTLLTFPNLKVQHGGKYTCIATNIAGSAEKEFDVEVIVTPKLEIPEAEVEFRPSVQLNRPVTLRCPLTGQPPPQIQWLKDMQPIDAGYDPNVYIPPHGKELTILRVREEDAGRYSCTANNEAGQYRLDQDLDVHIPPRIDPEEVRDVSKVPQNSNGVIECPAYGNPEPSFTWLKDGELLTEEESQHVKFMNSGRTLWITNASLKDEGTYTCVAANDAGTEEQDFQFFVQVPPTLEDRNNVNTDVSVLQNRPITLVCPVVGSPPPSIQWFKNGKLINRYVDPRVSISGNGRELKLRRARVSDQAKYKCVGLNDVGRTEIEFDLKVQVPPKIIPPSDGANRNDINFDKSSDVKGIENGTIVLECHAEGSPEPSIIWLKNGHLLLPTENKDKVQLLQRGQLLRITQVNIIDKGKYTCIASNDAGTSERNFDVDVFVPPFLKDEGDEVVEVPVNRPATLNCPVEGNPMPKIAWFKDDILLDIADNPFIRVVNEGRQLQILHALPEDSGRYSCVAENDVGQLEKEFELDVHVPPTVYISDHSPKVIEGDSIQLGCFSLGNPAPHLTWLRNGHVLEAEDLELLNLAFTKDGQSLYFPKATTAHAGSYTCYASNDAGTAEGNFYLDVIVPPHIFNNGSNDFDVLVNQPVTLNCQVDGKPYPNVSWRRGGEWFDPTADPFVRLLDNRQQLHFLRVQPKDGGKYTCVAKNSAGEDVKTFNINVLVPPKFTTIGENLALTDEPKEYKTLENSSTEFDCYVVGNPIPSLSWMKDGQFTISSNTTKFKLLHANQVLQILNIEVPDGGKYTCIATSSSGTRRKDFELSVQVPPKVADNVVSRPSVPLNHPTTIKCAATGNPPPEIFWLKDGIPIDTFRDSNLRILGEGSELQFWRARTSDAAKYTCLAVNDVGQAEQHFDLDVQVPPVIDRSNHIASPVAFANQTVVLECPASSHPPPEVTWLKDGFPLLVHDSQVRYQILNGGQKLKIHEILKDDSGKFDCVVYNDVGTDRAEFQLKVITPPVLNSDEAVSETQVKEGENTILRCPIENKESSSSVVWLKDGHILSTNSLPPHMGITDNGLTLKIRRVQEVDFGTYTCVVSNAAGEMEHDISLDVLVPPVILDSPGNVEKPRIMEQQSVTFECEVEGNPEPDVIWMKNGKEVHNQDGNIKVLPGGKRLRVTDVTENDAGIFKCIASNEAGLAEKSYELTVLVPARVNMSAIDSEHLVLQNDDVLLDCPASGNPPPRFIWYKDSQILMPNGRVLLSSDGMTLVVTHVTPKDSGRYVCMVVNEAGDSEAEFSVTVMVPPTINKLDKEAPSLVLVNHPVRLICDVDGLPAPKVTWKKNGIPLIAINTTKYSLTGGGRYLDFHTVEMSDEGVYICQAENEAGLTRANYTLDVLVPPEIGTEIGDYDIQVVLGDAVSIECPAIGDPPPAIVWLKEGHIVEEDKHHKLQNEGQVLLITEASEQDTAFYTCIATNEAGTTEEIFHLQVMVPPTIQNSGDDETHSLPVIVGRPLKLECMVDKGSPEPDISWSKGGHPLPETGDVVVKGNHVYVYHTSYQHSGVYTCEVSNPAGSTTKNFNVSVQVPPKIENSASPTFISTLLGEPAIFECPASGIPEPTIFWFKGDFPLVPEQRMQISKGGQNLLLLNVEQDDMSAYTCIATNTAGNSSKEFHLSVLVPPTIEDGPANMKVIVGNRISIDCKVHGYPQPQISWMKEGISLPFQSSTYQISSEGKLHFHSVRVHDSNNYTCISFNEAGTASKTVSLEVLTPPVIDKAGPSTAKVVVGQPVTLLCEVKGHPVPRVTWQKETQIITHNTDVIGYKILPTGSLYIQKVVPEDAGDYTCFSQNEAGSSQAQRKLDVLLPPRIISDIPAEMTAIQGHDVHLQCSAEGTAPFTTLWTRNGSPLDQSDPRIMFSPNGALQMFLIQPSDTGLYQCLVKNEAGADYRTTDLTVYVPPMIQSGDPKDIVEIRGSRVTLPCRAKGFPSPQVNWLHNGSSVTSRTKRAQIHHSGDLSIQNVEPEDSGVYVCIAMNEAGRQYKDVNLHVHVPPYFVMLPNDQDVTLGEEFSLFCEAEGVPTPSIVWFYNSHKMQGQPSSVRGRSTLKISSASREDSGQYTCLAENSAGERRVNATVHVRVPPVVLDSPGMQAVRLAEPVMLHCAVDGDPYPEIIWLKNGNRMELNHRIQQMNNGSLVIYASSDEDTGNYKCVASNEVGAAEGTATLVVRTEPSFIKEPQNTIADLGETVQLECQASGEPQPVVYWEKDQNVLESKGRISVLSNNTLQIAGLQLSDEGLYLCIASNPLGRKIRDATVIVRVHGHWSQWTEWSVQCSASCGEGRNTRKRFCNNPTPQNGGRYCIGLAEDSRICNAGACPVDGNWGEWQGWQVCSVSCGQGIRKRERACNNPQPQHGGKVCEGPHEDVEACSPKNCPVNGQWSLWSLWSSCTVTCGTGRRVRTRLCSNPAPEYGGLQCIGNHTEQEECKMKECEIHGGWGQWGSWSICSLSCGGGSRERIRRCDSPKPSYGGRYCIGMRNQVDYCNNEPCPVHGGWSSWSAWGECSASCNSGQRRRFRSCNNPIPNSGGRTCSGPSQDSASCNTHPCPVDGGWSSWGKWTPCSVTCGKGHREQKRFCNKPVPQHGGRGCVGNEVHVEECIEDPCEVLPLRVIGNLIGAINGEDVSLSRMTANISRQGMERNVSATFQNIPPKVADQLQTLLPLLSPVYWTAAYETAPAVNGFTLTKGIFRQEALVSYPTGEVLSITHVSSGLDNDGVLHVDTVVTGDVPQFSPGTDIEIHPFSEDYTQIGAGVLHLASSPTFRVKGIMLPYLWNVTIRYDESLGSMPFLVQRLQTTNPKKHYNAQTELMHFSILASIKKGTPSNKCPSGFVLDPAGPYCQDDNECSQIQLCSHSCLNTLGTFACQCPQGMTLGPDGHTCMDQDECQLGLSLCTRDQTCENTVGSYKCLAHCGTGFRRTYDGSHCVDINECEQDSEICDIHHCINVIGSYRCDCKEGFRQIGKSCHDIDECHQPSPPCSDYCVNVPGSYVCSCPHGFTLIDSTTCKDIDECALHMHTCREDQRCQNTPGSFRCIKSCPIGYSKAQNGSCIDIDECKLGQQQCHYSKICINTPGSYKCTCPEGYTSEGPGKPCTDIDECASEGRCQHQCENTPGSFHCICPTGYRLSSNGQTCQDIDECSELSINCGPDKMCFNLKGSFECLDTPCPPNYERDTITGYCKLECEKSGVACPANVKYSDILAFKTVALPSGIKAHQDLVRLVAYDQDGIHLPNTIFTVTENETGIDFRIRSEAGKGVLYTLQDLDPNTKYKIKVQAVSYDTNQRNVEYTTQFLVYISVSQYPY